jgi:glycosyltransferase involved in cell wall biosynthesis
VSEDQAAPLVTVVVPFRGNVNWLGEAVDSVLRQTFPHWDLIIVSDEPMSLTDHLVRLDHRIRVLKGKGTGPASNRNVGVRASTADYVAFLDADDAFYPEKLERQFQAMNHRGATFSHTSYEQVGPDSQTIGTITAGRFGGRVYPRILLSCPVATPTVIAHRDLLLENPFDETLGLGQGEDTVAWIALARAAGELLGIDEPLSRVRMHGGNVALDLEAQAAAWRSICEISLRADPSLSRQIRRRAKAAFHTNLALLERQRGRRLVARRESLQASFLRVPTSVMNFAAGAKHLALSPRSTLRRAWNRQKHLTPEIQWISRDEALSGETLRLKVVPARSVLDIGTGIRPQTLVSSEVHVCVEPFEPYVERLRQDVGDDARFILLRATWDQVIPLLPDNSIDSVVALDVIEHLRRREGVRFLAEALRVARRQVIIFTPLGFYRQSYRKGQRDRWGMAGGHWQTHRSGWMPDDFAGNWEVIACADFHDLDDLGRPLAQPFGAFWAIYSHHQSGDGTSWDGGAQRFG